MLRNQVRTPGESEPLFWELHVSSWAYVTSEMLSLINSVCPSAKTAITPPG
jgi:hypothetical protein